jgi:hypothetical protein
MADAPDGAAGPGTTDTLLAFLTTSCAECQPFWEMLAAPATRADLGAQVAVVTPSRSMEDERLARRLVPEGVYLHMGSETWFAYGIGRAASFALVRSPRNGPAPWEELGKVLGAANVDAPEELVRLVKTWRAAASA